MHDRTHLSPAAAGVLLLSLGVAAHRRWMVRNFEHAYPAVAWLCWVPNVVVAERILARKG